MTRAERQKLAGAATVAALTTAGATVTAGPGGLGETGVAQLSAVTVALWLLLAVYDLAKAVRLHTRETRRARAELKLLRLAVAQDGGTPDDEPSRARISLVE